MKRNYLWKVLLVYAGDVQQETNFRKQDKVIK
jgi:hypothetical protein